MPKDKSKHNETQAGSSAKGSEETASDKSEIPRSEFRETLSVLVWALGLAFILRTFIFQPFHIPSGSMEPSFVEGDYVVTTKYSLGYGKYAAAPFPFPVKTGRLFERKPERGDVIVFRPQGQNNNYIKRLVGLPGDEIQMVDGRLYINGQKMKTVSTGFGTRIRANGLEEKTETLQEVFEGKDPHLIYDIDKRNELDNTSVFVVPSAHYFFMGDNRDRSADSRVPVRSNGAGYVPAENLIGKARLVLLSVNDDFSLFKPWTWLNFRKDRFFKVVK